MSVATDKVPVELRSRTQWVCWRLEDRDGKRTKVPYQPSSPNVRASTTDPATWGDYQTAVNVTDADGIGFVFAEGDGLAGVDLDHCLTDGRLDDGTAAFVLMTLDSYAERSPSGTGLHVIIRAELNGGRRRTGNFEVYDCGRFFTITGDHWADTPLTVNERQEQLDEVRASIFPPAPEPQKRAPAVVSSADDRDVLELARNAKNGRDFDSLYSGRWDGYDSQSEADLALCNLLAFWCGPYPDRIDGLFRGSGLMREKWDGSRGDSSYGEQTVARALEGRTEFYEAPKARTSSLVQRNTSVTDQGTPTDIAITLDTTETFIRRYVALSEAQYIAVTLWVVHAHALEATATTPYLHVTSPEAECGKSRLLECMEPLTPRPMYAANLTPAVMFRVVQKFAPTLLVDEADNLMKDREAKSELLGLLNAGYRRGAFAYRMGGGNRDELLTFETFCAKVIAGLDDLVATLASRCLRIEMQRRQPDEPIEDFFREDAHAEAAPIRDALAAWAEQATEELRAARPERLGVRDRLEEAVRLLLAIAEMAGERWDARARDALRELAGVNTDGAMSERTQLLSDVRQVFGDHGLPVELASADLLTGLIELPESPWRGWWGVERDDEVRPSKGAGRKLSEKLRAFQIRSHNIGEARRKGYRLADFEPVWRRYLLDSPEQAAGGDSNPLNPLKPHEKAKNEPLVSAQEDEVRADIDHPQTRMVEPNERNERIQARTSATNGSVPWCSCSRPIGGSSTCAKCGHRLKGTLMELDQ
jgi:putative DNA primase/helicase